MHIQKKGGLSLLLACIVSPFIAHAWTINSFVIPRRLQVDQSPPIIIHDQRSDMLSSPTRGRALYAQSDTETILWVRDFSNTFDGQRYQFKDITLSVARGQKIGLVGINGCGKSTLLRGIGGVEKCEKGEITSLKGLQVVYVDQEPEFPAGSKVRDIMFSADSSPAMAAVREYQLASDELAAGTSEAYDRFQKASAKMDATGGWEAETLANQIYSQLNVLQVADKSVDTLSGGERKRLGLASALVRKPDVILFDEPTNHMDLSAIQWLESHLTNKAVTAIIVTHDRYFLETVCGDEIWELEDAQLYRHSGNYEDFLEGKAMRLASQDANRAADLKKLKKELEWMRKQPRARQAKSKSRQQNYHELVKKTTKKEEVKKLSLEAAKARLGTFVLAFDDASLRFEAAGKDILKSFTYEFAKGDRVGIVGPNGVGKSTFLSVLIGNQPLDSGEVIKGETVRFGYYSQMGMKFREDCRVIEFVKDAAEDALAKEAMVDSENNLSGEQLARQLLARFQFSPGRQQDLVSKLSGGERRRLQLMWVLAQRPNFLVLDEPSNDLDLTTLAALEEFLLEEYKGVLVLVSHDRRFMDKCSNHLFVFQGDGVVRDFNGSFSDWLEIENEMKAEAASMTVSSSTSKKAMKEEAISGKKGVGGGGGGGKRVSLSGKEKVELRGMEKAIDALQKQVKEYEAKLENEAGTGYSQLAEWSNRIEKLNEEIMAKEERWLELMEKAEA